MQHPAVTVMSKNPGNHSCITANLHWLMWSIVGLIVCLIGGALLFWFWLPTRTPDFVIRYSPRLNPALSAALMGEEHEKLFLKRVSQMGSCAIPELSHELQAADPLRRRLAAHALGMIPDSSALPSLIISLNDPDAVVFRWAAASLAQLADPQKSIPFYYGESYKGIQIVDEAAVNILTEKLLDLSRDDLIRKSSAFALGYLRDSRCVTPLIMALGDPNLDVRCYSAESLGRIRDSKAVGSLLGIIEGNNVLVVKESACLALGKIGDQRATGPLINILLERNNLSNSAATALAEIGDQTAIDSLLEALTVDNGSLRDSAAKALECFQLSSEQQRKFLEYKHRP